MNGRAAPDKLMRRMFHVLEDMRQVVQVLQRVQGVRCGVLLNQNVHDTRIGASRHKEALVHVAHKYRVVNLRRTSR